MIMKFVKDNQETVLTPLIPILSRVSSDKAGGWQEL